jgi:YD repeat-containing protein
MTKVQTAMMARIMGLFVLYMGVAGTVLAQTPPQSTDLKQVITPSPTSSALGQFGNVPVGLYTGSAQVNIPLYEVKEGALSLPITMSYNSSGIKVADMASWVGLGFSLNAGGCISRTVYGLPDEAYRTNPSYVLPSSPTNGQTKQELMNLADYQPDVFYFNFNGRSGKFMLSNTSTISTAPHQNLKIQAYYQDGITIMNPPFYGVQPLLFRVTDENGTVYEFKNYETNRTVSFNPLVTQSPLLNAIGVPLASITAWYLTDMYSPTGDTIRFVYGNYELLYDQPSSEQQFKFTGQSYSRGAAPTQQPYVLNAVRCQNENLRLQQILFSNGSVNFYANQPRLDLIGDTALTQMMIFNKNGTPVRGYSFNYQYSYAGDYISPPDGVSPAPTDNYYADYINGISTASDYRLMLTGISELDNNYIADGRNYYFSYNTAYGSLPSRFSTQRDYWGYSNGNDYTPTNFLTYQLTGSAALASSYLIIGKDPDSNFCRQGSLSQITYPTGGYTQFNYELHTAYVGPGVLPPVPTNQSLTMSIDFPSYPDGYTDTVINGLNCVYSTFTFTSPSGAYANIAISNILYQNGIHPLLRFDIYDSANQPYLQYNLEISGSTQVSYVQINDDTRVYSYTLNDYYFPQGTYKVIFYPLAGFIGNTTYLDTYLGQPSFSISGWSNLVYSTDTVDISRNIGGLRIRSTVDYDPVSGKTLEKDYGYNSIGSNTSSGSMVAGMSFVYPLTECVINTSDDITENYYYPYMILNSESNYALSTTQGSYVGYSAVTETDIDPSTGIPNGKSEYHYTSPAGYPDAYGMDLGPADNFPYPVADSRDWQRGLLLQRTDYQYINGQYLPIKVENDTYLQPVYVDTAMGYTSRYTTEVFPAIADTGSYISFGGEPALNPEQFSGMSYSLTGGYVPLISKSVTMIQNGDSITETSNYTYADAPSNLLPTSIAQPDSKGNVNTTYMTYPFDYSVASPTTSQGQGILNLQQQHIISAVVEKDIRKTSSTGTDMGAISGVYTTFKPTQTLPDTVFKLESYTPVLGYTPVSLSNSGTLMDTHYMPYISFNGYDNYGNILQQQKVYDLSHSYVWDYHEKFPIAEVKNAQYSDIAYTSFEADGSGGWTVGTGTVDTTTAITGTNSYILSSGSTISASGLNSSTTYIVSYWTENSSYFNIAGTISGYPVQGKTENINGNQWTLYVHKVTGQSTITLMGGSGGHIDELRLYPSTAQMTTYTYSPLVGMTSQTDVGNRVTYYQYDGLARLKRIRDQDYNILKTYEYQYQVPAGCNGCQTVAMETFLGTNTIGYPVGVFDIHGNLVGNAAGASAFVSLWNSDTADARIGTLSTGNDSLHFNIILNTGQTLPTSVTGCRYYQYDLSFNELDGVRYTNGTYVDFGDSTGMHLGTGLLDTPKVMAPRTTFEIINDFYYYEGYLIHTYPSTSLKTITFYHNDANENSALDNANNPATSLMLVTNLRGNLPQNTNEIGGSSYQQPGALTVSGIINWNSITSVHYFDLQNGDRVNNVNHVNYAQDFMQNNKGLDSIYTQECSDTTFKLNLLKSNWNTWFTNLYALEILDNQWNRDDISGLTNLKYFLLVSASTNGLGTNGISVLDNIINQIAAGGGKYQIGGVINITWPGFMPTSASQPAIQFLKSKEWTIYINGVYE